MACNCILIKLFSLVLISVFSVIKTDACMCPLNPMTDQYAQATWVAKVRVMSSRIVHPFSIFSTTFPPEPKRRYEVMFLETFKGREVRNSIFLMDFLYTDITEERCGVFLEENRTYVLSGEKSEGRLRIQACGIQIDVDEVIRKMFGNPEDFYNY